MSSTIALSVSIAVLGAVWAFLALTDPLSNYLVVWAGFIAWGCFFHTGGDTKALTKTIAGNVYGVIIGWVALLIIVNVSVPLPGALWPAIVVGVTVFFLVVVLTIEPLSAVPANVYGYAAIVAYSLSVPSPAPAEGQAAMGPLNNLLAASSENPLIMLIISMVIGALFGFASGQLSGKLTKKEA